MFDKVVSLVLCSAHDQADGDRWNVVRHAAMNGALKC
jgi:hypothetical protein